MRDLAATLIKTMETCLDQNHLDGFMHAHYAYYERVIKIREKIDHHETCFDAIEALTEKFGGKLKKTLPKRAGKSVDEVCYFLPSLNNDMAHIEFLHSILKRHPVGKGPKIIVAGFTFEGDARSSRLIEMLRRDGRIKMARVSFTAKGMAAFCRWLIERNVGLLVIYSSPLFVSAWTKALGPGRVAWATTKFELASFPSLRHRLSFAGPGPGATVDTREIRGRGWRRSAAGLARLELPKFKPESRTRTRLISINREAKMATPEFLGAVTSILEAEPLATFSWTGRTRSPDIQDFFERRGVADRCQFIGWVVPAETLGQHDIFLDTYGLSGMVATQAFCAGIPTVFFRASRAWIENHEYAIATHPSADEDGGLEIALARSTNDYVASVLALIQSRRLYMAQSVWQTTISETFLLDQEAMYAGHMAALRAILSEEGAPCPRCA